MLSSSGSLTDAKKILLHLHHEETWYILLQMGRWASILLRKFFLLPLFLFNFVILDFLLVFMLKRAIVIKNFSNSTKIVKVFSIEKNTIFVVT